MRPNVSFFDFYDEYPSIEGTFQAALDESLSPRGPEFLYEIVGRLGLPPGANAVDLGCGEGRQSIKLAEDFEFAVQGIDLVPRQIELADEELGRAAERKPELSGLVRFRPGSAEEIPLPDASVDLIWCREMLMLVDVDKAFAECRRVLRSGGWMLIYQVFSADRIEPRGAGWHAEHVESAFTAAGFQIDERIELTSEGGERAQEETGEPGRRLLHAARLLRDPQRYIAKFGRSAYDIMLGDCLWHVYRMIGKLSARVYLLKASERS
ncbi:MAG: class I SAM-dependent methyltransferase [Chloroflexota bacterium]|nr:class I SAM-dependent methyltransferase [Chloroflexota bacterium]